MSLDELRDVLTAWEERFALLITPVIAPIGIVVGVILLSMGNSSGWFLVLVGLGMLGYWVYRRVLRRD
ncbi:hypothetical protein [Protaetiibacter intestinalis]|uniref:Uncharacterized protein n=1 Tax=Protaetiibacter intestinalis TaxID=2419774 RepID=A0A387B6P8_9MICO|nr:hypothetical protein [Protaetiibacter intestinalis]AYF96875.1 hypothetical protein D7I47_00480 [Protaetiibacter intestinalis]